MKALVALVAGLVLVAGFAMAQQDAAAAKDVTVTGKVVVAKDEAGKVTKVTVGDYSIVQDEAGKKLVDMAGKDVKVAGKAVAKDLTVAKCEEVKAEVK
jgi:hypothetical protein